LPDPSASADDERFEGVPEPFRHQPVRYIDRTRAWYEALGYAPYRWPHFDDVPFTPLSGPLAGSRLALVTTAAPYQPGRGDQGPGAAYNGGAKFFEVYASPTAELPDLRISHIGYDRAHTSAEDQNTWFPLLRLQEAVAEGRLGGLTDRFHGVPTVRSQRTTIEEHAPEIRDRCLADGADVALLVPV
jgi:D-proline reductase (dithiol) PrdB